jgi:hypothetical protein
MRSLFVTLPAKVLCALLLLCIFGEHTAGSERSVAWIPTCQIPCRDQRLASSFCRAPVKGPTEIVMAATLDDGYRDVGTVRTRARILQKVREAVGKSEPVFRWLSGSPSSEQDSEEMYCNLPAGMDVAFVHTQEFSVHQCVLSCSFWHPWVLRQVEKVPI